MSEVRTIVQRYGVHEGVELTRFCSAFVYPLDRWELPRSGGNWMAQEYRWSGWVCKLIGVKTKGNAHADHPRHISLCIFADAGGSTFTQATWTGDSFTRRVQAGELQLLHAIVLFFDAF